MSKIIYTYDNPPSEKHVAQAVSILLNDGLIAYPTDVNWAFGCLATKPSAVDRLRSLKPGKPKDQPFSLICSDMSMISQVAHVDSQSFRLLKKALPGPYTIVLERNRNLPRFLKDNRKAVGVRVPNCLLILAILKLLGEPTLSTSAPALRDGRFAKFGYELEEEFGHRTDLILDSGQESPWLETTVVDLSQGSVEIIRIGAGDPSLFT